MKQFRIGTKIRGKSSGIPYSRTTYDAICQVIAHDDSMADDCEGEEAKPGEILVKIINHKYLPYSIGEQHWVEPQHFEQIKPNKYLSD